MANFSQLRRRQSSREILWRAQLAGLDLHEDGTATFHPGMAAGAAGRQRRPSARASLRRQFSEAASGAPSAAGSGSELSKHHASPDEMGEIMWEFRPRFATSAGELKRRHKHKYNEERERQRTRVRSSRKNNAKETGAPDTMGLRSLRL